MVSGVLLRTVGAYLGSCLGLDLLLQGNANEEENSADNNDLQQPQPQGLMGNLPPSIRGDEQGKSPQEENQAVNSDLQPEDGDLLPRSGDNEADNADLLPLNKEAHAVNTDPQPAIKGHTEEDEGDALPLNEEDEATNIDLQTLQHGHEDEVLSPPIDKVEQEGDRQANVHLADAADGLHQESTAAQEAEMKATFYEEFVILQALESQKDLNVMVVLVQEKSQGKPTIQYEAIFFSIYTLTTLNLAVVMYVHNACFNGVAKDHPSQLATWVIPIPRPRVKMKVEIKLYYLTTGMLDPGIWVAHMATHSWDHDGWVVTLIPSPHHEFHCKRPHTSTSSLVFPTIASLYIDYPCLQARHFPHLTATTASPLHVCNYNEEKDTAHEVLQAFFFNIHLPFTPLRGRKSYQGHESQFEVKIMARTGSQMKPKPKTNEMGLHYINKDLLDPG